MVNINQPRKLDSAGRISLPKGIRDKFAWNEGTEFELFESEAFETDALMIVPAAALSHRSVEEEIDAVCKAYDISDEMFIRDLKDAVLGQ